LVPDIPEPPPDTWSPLIGDVLHNLHSTLDHLAWQLASRRRYGVPPAPDTRATFPIFNNRARFWKRNQRRTDWSAASGATALRRFPGDSRQLVLAVQPYEDGNRAEMHPLWLLHVLSNEDKHKTLHVVQAALVDHDFEILELEDVRIDHFTPKPGPIRGRTEIGRVGTTIIGPNPKCRLQLKFGIAEAFAEGPPAIKDRYVGNVFTEIFQYIHIDVFARRFGPYFGVADWPLWLRDFTRSRQDEYPE
jgi:hypothetical protein